jgi:chromate transporter
VIAAPYYRRFAAKPRIKGFIDGVTAGAVGAIAGAVIVLGRKSLVDVPTIAIAGLSLAAILVVKKLPEPVLILASAAGGIALRGLRS